MFAVKQIQWARAGLVGLTLCAAPSVALAAAEKPQPGLAVEFTALDEKSRPTDLTVAPNVCLFVAAGQAPTPFLPAGRFSASWAGTLQADLRGEFAFQAELNGQFKLEINGAAVLEMTGRGSVSPLSKPVQLNKGANVLKATFTSPAQGDAFVRLAWTEKGPDTSPIPLSVLTHAASPALHAATRLRLGRELFLEHRCAHCHTGKWGAAALPELKMDAPSFAGLGARRNVEWMARWILDPKALRPTARMPRLLHGAKAKAEAEAIAVYLASLKSSGEEVLADATPKPQPAAPGAAEATAAPTEEHKDLFDKLRCAACHSPSDATPGISLKQVAEKFAPGQLAEFLRRPEAHYVWTAMPNFKLTEAEAKELSDYLLASADKPKAAAAADEGAVLERGKKLVQTSGCLNCHTLKLENQFSAPQLAELPAARWRQGCVAGPSAGEARTPQFGFRAEEQEALAAFGATDRSSLTRHVPADFAERQGRALQCVACHGQIDGVPPLEILGEKLKPEWVAQFIGGEIPYKPRTETHPRGEPWLAARMPAFKSRALGLAEGFAAQHGYPPRTPAEPPIDMELAKLGQKLVGKDGGFSCVSCHGVGSLPAMEVFESEGINLAYSAERLLLPFYRRWMRSPLSIDPQTKMPSYFEEGKSPLTEILDGDAEKQITALWHYIRLGDKMPAPATGQ